MAVTLIRYRYQWLDFVALVRVWGEIWTSRKDSEMLAGGHSVANPPCWRLATDVSELWRRKCQQWQVLSIEERAVIEERQMARRNEGAWAEFYIPIESDSE